MPQVTTSLTAPSHAAGAVATTSSAVEIHSTATNGMNHNHANSLAGSCSSEKAGQDTDATTDANTVLNNPNSTTTTSDMPQTNTTKLTAPNITAAAAGGSPANPPSSDSSAPPSSSVDKPISQAEKEARRRAWREASSEDEKRMRFLALLCGRGSFPENSSNNNNSSFLRGRDRTTSIGGMGDDNGTSRMDTDHHDSRHAFSTDLENNDPIGKTLPGHPTSGGGAGIIAQNPLADPSLPLPPNYQPTTPQNLSRRILHKQGVGYLDDAVSLLLSAASDRFLAAVLTQAAACRDRRLEGYKALLVERKERKRHRRKVLKERTERERRFREEIEKRRKGAEDAMKEAEDGKKGVKAPIAPVVAPALEEESFQVTQADLERLKEFRKDNEDLDAEEDYYHNYFGKNEYDWDDNEVGGKTAPNGDNEEESDEYDSEEEIDDKQYDLLLRDIVRPLGAWGFDLTSKIGFSSADTGMDEESEYVVEADKEDDDGDQEEEAEEEDADNNEEKEESDNDEEGNGAKKPPSPVKNSSPVKNKASAKKTASKRKREEADGDKKGAPAAKKTAVNKSSSEKVPSAVAPSTSQSVKNSSAAPASPPKPAKKSGEK
ncbi:hypothetical protein ACHAWX_001989 [Stephanocyclus meneghinianus]